MIGKQGRNSVGSTQPAGALDRCSLRAQLVARILVLLCRSRLQAPVSRLARRQSDQHCSTHKQLGVSTCLTCGTECKPCSPTLHVFHRHVLHRTERDVGTVPGHFDNAAQLAKCTLEQHYSRSTAGRWPASKPAAHLGCCGRPRDTSGGGGSGGIRCLSLGCLALPLQSLFDIFHLELEGWRLV